MTTTKQAIPTEVRQQLKFASTNLKTYQEFSCDICGNEWDLFIEEWAAVCHAFVGEALAGYHTNPLPTIKAMKDPQHTAGANASFNIVTGQVTLCPSIVEGKPGTTIEKLLHEFTHGALAGFPEGDPFYEEGYVDYSVWVMAHAPIWGMHKNDVINAAAYNIKCRRDRAMKSQSDYDRKRWAGGLFAATALGPWIITHLSMKKIEGNLTW